MYRHFLELVDSDMASTLVAAWHMAWNGFPISPSWYYSTELAICDSQVIFSVLFWFTQDWRVVRLVGTAILYLILLASYYFLCSQAGLKRSYPITASVLLMPFSNSYFMYMLIGVYYIPDIATVFLMAGLMLRCMRKESRSSFAWSIALLVLISLVSGMTSIRRLALFHVPAFCAAALFHIICQSKLSTPLAAMEDRQSNRLLISALVSAVGASAGYILNSLVLSKIFTFSNYNSVQFQYFNAERLNLLINDVFEFFGYQSGTSLFSSGLAGAVACFGILVLAVISVCHCLMRKKQIAHAAEINFITIHFVAACIVLLAILALTNVSYWAACIFPVVLFVFPVIASWFMERHDWKFGWKTIVFAIIGCALVVNSAGMYLKLSDKDKTYELRLIADDLVKEGYTDGYATFWQANVFAELAGGKIDMRIWADETALNEMMDVGSIYPWLQSKLHETTVPQGKPFFLFSKWYNQHTDFSLGQWLDEADAYYETKNYIVYAYDSYDDMLRSITQRVEANYANGGWSPRRYGITGNTSLQPGSRTHGPDIPLYPGIYRVTVTGEGLKDLLVGCSTASGELAVQNLVCQDAQITFEVTSPDLLRHFALHLENGNTQTVRLENMLLEKIANLP